MYNANEVMSIMVAAEKAYNEIAANANNGWKTFVNVIDANWNGQDACMVKTNLGDILHTVYNDIENSLSVFRANLYGVVGRMLSVQGETAKLVVKGYDPTTESLVNIPYEDLRFISNNENIATVNAKGVVTGVAEGVTTVTVNLVLEDKDKEKESETVKVITYKQLKEMTKLFEKQNKVFAS